MVSGIQSSLSRLAARLLVATLKVRRRGEAAEFAFNQFGELDRRAVLKKSADDLHPDRQVAVAFC